MTPLQHCKSLVSLLAISSNLLAWSFVLIPLVCLRVLPALRPLAGKLLADVYRAAVRVDHLWFTRVLGIEMDVPDLPLDSDSRCIVIANHQSWVDIFIIQSAISRRGPPLTFLVKRELVLVPILGLIFFAFHFPMLERRSSSTASSGETDRDRIGRACRRLRGSPFAILSFVEGTRFTPAKHLRLGSTHRHLLPPRSGGFTQILETLGTEEARIVDVTLVYRQATSFWGFLSGDLPPPCVTVEMLPTPVVTDARNWLEERWHNKDLVIDATLDAPSGQRDGEGD